MTIEPSRWETELASVVDVTREPENDELRVEIRLDGEDFGFIRETAVGLELTIFAPQNGDRWSVPVHELTTVLENARRRLTE